MILLPVSKKAETITLTPGATLAGVRFHPAIGYGVLGKHWNTPTRLCPKDDNKFALYQTFATLQQQCDALHRIEALYQWAETYLDFTNLLPASLEQALKRLEDGASPGQLNDNVPLSQRQIERQFQLWLEMTPKHYQRILRIKKTIDYLRSYKNANLAEVAQYLGFSDQAHMTREFRDIARTTPGKI